MTRVTEQQISTENIPFISVRTQPKKKVSQQAARLRRLEMPANPTRGYVDPATLEQHKMISQTAEMNAQRRNNIPRTVRSGRADGDVINQKEERPVVELFSKSRNSPSPEFNQQNIPTYQTGFFVRSNKKGNDVLQTYDENTGPLEEPTATVPHREVDTIGAVHRVPHRIKNRTRRYEMPTVASRMKQTGARYYAATTNTTNIPFVVSKSTAPSHNIGVNIQQTPMLENHEINAIRLGRRLLRLPTYKYMSYRRLLNLYREGDGMVSRFLRAINRPHYFYTSMYNSLVTNREDIDGARSKGRGGDLEVRQSLAEYTALYREYEQLEKSLAAEYVPELARRRDELQRELASREEHIRKVVKDYENTGETEPSMLRASASIAEETYRHSTFKLNSGDA
ncbi:unnamed protein product [Parnassius apollo]|uniref:(apollo) hypothetical protein n=1 Tax=Parnassius apollo TaxID=110799 RepID=A0A8S3WIS2_PARAO|nr:unnamed protein product [Parnassius apollo]